MSKRSPTSIMIKARRTELVDAQEVVKFVNNSTIDSFGPNVRELGKIFELIEKSVLAITLEDETNNTILAQACFFDYPNVYNVPKRDWESWLNTNYKADKNNSLNTLFLHFFASQSEFSIGCAQEIIKSAFKAVPECHYILLCVPLNCVPESSLSTIFNEMKRLPNRDSDTTQPNCAIFVANREKHVPVLHIRAANVNDNDDLIPLFNSYTDLLKATYGDFYVAEMIEAQNEHNKCLAAEADGLAIGFMAITKDVNVSLLNECFELRPFHGLCKRDKDDVLEPPADAHDDDDDVLYKTNNNNKPDHNGEYVPQVKHKLSDAGIVDSYDMETGVNMAEESQRRLNEYRRENSDTNSQSSSNATNEQNYNVLPTSVKRTFIPKYAGESNAFAIQLFCIEEKYESRSLDFLPKAFESFPDKDFCVITLPPNVPEFALIQNFIRVTPRDTNKIKQELYLFHRAGLIKSFDVREANKASDYQSVDRLVQNLSSREAILKDLTIYLKSRKDKNGIDVQAYVAEVLGRIVGVAIIRQEEDIEFLRSSFNIDDFVYYTHHKREEHGHINHFALIPIFSYLTKYFIKEILRKSNKTCLYYPIYPEYAPVDISQKYSLITALNFMVPVKKRNQIEYTEKLGINLPSEFVLKPRFNYALPCSLNHINRKLLLEPKIAINLRIIVVGASELAISFLENLAFSPHLRFNNLCLVSTNGLPGGLPPDPLRDNMRAQTLNYNQTDHASLSLRSWINIVVGKMTSIDRRNKHIVVNGRTILPYDHLILCTGEQYYHIAPIQARVYNSYSKQEVKPHITRPLFDVPPPNMFVVNNEYEAESLLEFIENNNFIQSTESIVIYGMDLNVYCTIQTLIKLGIDPHRINIFCDKNAANCFNNPYVNSKLSETFKEYGIKLNESFHMHEWNNGKWKSGQNLKNILFQINHGQENGSSRTIQIDCCLLLCFYKKDVDYTTFIAANQSHLVYDGRLIIDNEFHTNDSCIRAAGKMTKYKRSYYVDGWSHACFNQKEIGNDLAFKILKLVDPTLVTTTDTNVDNKTDSARIASNQPDESVLIPLYKRPIITYAVLPGDYHYLHVTKSGLYVAFDVENNEGLELITNGENGYFRIHLNKNKCIETITCLSKKKFNHSNLSKLYGLHEQFLNKLILKYNQKTIKDFFVYFNENWCTALYHDRFEDLCKEIRELSMNSNNGLKSVNELLNELVDKDLILTKDQHSQVSDYFVKSQTKSQVEKRLLNYLNYNYNHLPMYAKPDMV